MALEDWESVRTGAKMGEGTVIILGAGASKHLELPLADELLPEMFAYANDNDWENWGGDHQKKDLFEFLTAINPSFKNNDQRNPGLEYFLSHIDVYQDFLAKGVMGKEDKTVQLHKKCLLQILVDYMWNKMRKSSSKMKKSPYCTLVSCLKYKDTILSLNWDLACEWAFHLSKRQKDWSYLPQRGKVPLLKLHGSINWRPKLEGIKPAHPKVFCPLGEDIHYWEGSIIPGQSEELRLSLILDAVPVIIPPSYLKTMENKTLGLVWREAYHRLLACERIIIVGSSLREEDRHLHALLSLVFWNWKDAITSSKEKVVKIVGLEGVAEKFRKNIFPKCELLDTKFEQVNWSKELLGH